MGKKIKDVTNYVQTLAGTDKIPCSQGGSDALVVTASKIKEYVHDGYHDPAKISEPQSDGTSGQCLITDGAGGRSWATVGGGGGGGGVVIVNDLTTGGTSSALSAEMGKTLKQNEDRITPITGTKGLIEHQMDVDTYIYVHNNVEDPTKPIVPVDVTGAEKVSIRTVMNYNSAAMGYKIVLFTDSQGNTTGSLDYTQFTHSGDNLHVIENHPVPQGSTRMKVVAWNQSAYDAKKSECYIKVYKQGVTGGTVGDVQNLGTTAKSNLVAALNEVNGHVAESIAPLESTGITAGNTVYTLTYAKVDEKELTQSSSLADYTVVVWKIGAGRHVKVNDRSKVISIVATETQPVKGATGTTPMAQFGPTLIGRGAVSNIGSRVMIDSFTMPSEYLCVCVEASANLGSLFTADGMVGRVSSLERSRMNFFAGKKVSFVGDSLLNDGDAVCRHFASLTGMDYVNREYGVLSMGATKTLEASRPSLCGQTRARKLAEADIVDPDVLVVENVNDGEGSDHTDAEIYNMVPFMLQAWTDFNSGGTTKSGAEAYFSTNFSTITGGITPQLGHMVRVGYGTQAYTISVTSGASLSGAVSVVIDGTSYEISVSAGDTAASVAQNLSSVLFGSFTVTYTAGATSLLLTNTSATAAVSCTFVSGTTGCYATVQETSSMGYVGYCYRHTDTSEWTNAAKWESTETIPLLAVYKGLVKYLTTSYPDMWLFWMLPNRFDNIEAATGDNINKRRNRRIRKWMQELGVPVLDVERESSITEWNNTNFCTSGIHTNAYDKGAARWAEAMARCLL